MKSKLIKSRSVFDIINTTVMLLIGLVILLPILNVFAKAFSAEGHVIAGNVLFWPKEFQLDTIRYVLRTVEFQRSFLVSVIVTLSGTLGAMLVTTLAAYPLSKPLLAGRKAFLSLFVFCMLFNAGMIPNYMLYRALHFINTLWALIFSGMFSIFNLLLVKNYFEGLPDTIEEAARIDGANDIKTFFNIVLPMSMPVLATVTLFYAVGYWGNYFSGVLYITNPNLKPLQQYLYDLIASVNNLTDSTGNITDVDQAMNISGQNIRSATIVVSTVPILLVYPFLQKYFVKGITIGSVKG